jgi:cholesterol transport system auxiliary component
MNLPRVMASISSLQPVAFLCLAAITLVSLSGCSLKKAYPAKQAFLVEARRSGEARASTASSVLRVRNLNIAAPFEGKGFIYRKSDLGYESDFYHEFLVPPRALLTEQIRQWLGASGVFRFSLDSASRADATHSLDGNVLALYGDYRESASPKAVLMLEFFLSNDQPATSEIVFHKSYRQEVSLENRAAETLAKGWGKALEQILSALEQDLVKVPK